MRNTLTVYVTVCYSDKGSINGKVKVFYNAKKAYSYIDRQTKKYEGFTTIYFELFKKRVIE